MNVFTESADGSTEDTSWAVRNALWTRHWATGASHSCGTSYGELYGGAIADFWRLVFPSLTAAERVLDLATGNGALPRLLLDMCPETTCTVDAIDAAAIEPAWLGALPRAMRNRVRFHGRQPAEALPFSDATFDLVVSQYGIEYSDLDRSVPEMQRVLAPGGRIALLMHVRESRPVALAAVELAHLDWLMSDAGLLPATAAMLEPFSRSGTAKGRESLATDPAAEATRERFNCAQDALRARAKMVDGADILFEIQNAVAAVLGMAVQNGLPIARTRLNEIELAAQDLYLRLRQLRQHALTRQQLAALRDKLKAVAGSDGTLVVGEVWEQGYLMACTVTLNTGAGASPRGSDC